MLVLLIAPAAAAKTRCVDAWRHGYLEEGPAIAGVLSDLKAKLGDERPTIIFMAATSNGLNVPALAAAIQREFPDTPVWGSTSALGVFMNNDLAYMHGRAIGLLALVSDEYDCYVDGEGVDPKEDDYDATMSRIIERARQNAAGRTPSMILLTSDPGPHEERALTMLKRAFGAETPIFGGSCGTEAPDPRFAIANGQAHPCGFAVCFMYTSRSIGHCYQMGFRRLPVSGVATDVDGRWLKSIDDRPAMDVYNEWTDGFFDDILRSGASIRGAGQMHRPLAIVKHNAEGEELLIALSARQVDSASGAVELFACVEKGDVLTVLKGDVDSLVRRAYLGAAKASRMAKGRIAGGLIFHCSGARLLLEREGRTASMAPYLQNAFQDRPYLLIFQNGEHGCLPGGESFHGNLMLGAVVFGE